MYNRPRGGLRTVLEAQSYVPEILSVYVVPINAAAVVADGSTEKVTGGSVAKVKKQTSARDITNHSFRQFDILVVLSLECDIPPSDSIENYAPMQLAAGTVMVTAELFGPSTTALLYTAGQGVPSIEKSYILNDETH